MKLQRQIFCNGIFFCFFLSPMLPCRVCDDGSHESRAERDETRREREKEFVSGNGVVVVVATAPQQRRVAVCTQPYFLLFCTLLFSFFCKYPAFLLSFFSGLKLVNWGFFFPKRAKNTNAFFFWRIPLTRFRPPLFFWFREIARFLFWVLANGENCEDH
jgi:hypothetical protein